MIDRVQDRKQRLQALDPTRSYIVQAPAGSGKTELLIQRFLTLLGQVEQPEAVVAITFTRKAAAEMRHRVIAALQSASGPQPDTPHEKHTWKLAQAALAQNDERNWRLTEHPSRLRIQTIDSLCALLFGRCPGFRAWGLRSARKKTRGTYTFRRPAEHWPCWIPTGRGLNFPGPCRNFSHTWTTTSQRSSGC